MAAIAPSTFTGSGRPNSLLARLERALDRANHPDVLAFELELERHLEQPRGARIARVEPVAEPRRRLALASGSPSTSVSAASLQRLAAAHQRRARCRGTACTTRCRRRGAARTPGCRPPRSPSAARPTSRRCGRRASTAASRRDRATRRARRSASGRSPASAARPSAADTRPRRTTSRPIISSTG